jgi:hypothetical protein
LHYISPVELTIKEEFVFANPLAEYNTPLLWVIIAYCEEPAVPIYNKPLLICKPKEVVTLPSILILPLFCEITLSLSMLLSE